MTISDIAKLANVSPSAVSIVINDKPGVSDKTREKVLKIIKKHNFNPNQIAQSLAAKATKSIGLIIKEIDNPHFAKVMKGVYDTTSELGYSVLLGSSELSSEKEEEILNTIISKKVDGLIISPIVIDDDGFRSISNLLSTNFPFVVLGMIDNVSVNSVDIDNKMAAKNAVSHLIELGHTKISHFGGPKHSGHAKKRLSGYQQGMLENGLKVNNDFVFSVGPSIQESYSVAKELFSSNKEKPTAIFCYNDLMAIGIMNALEELNISVPDSVSIIGFDNIDFGSYLKIPLTTIDIPAYNIGREATKLLIKQINSPELAKNEKVILDHKIINRETCIEYGNRVLVKK